MFCKELFQFFLFTTRLCFLLRRSEVMSRKFGRKGVVGISPTRLPFLFDDCLELLEALLARHLGRPRGLRRRTRVIDGLNPDRHGLDRFFCGHPGQIAYLDPIHLLDLLNIELDGVDVLPDVDHLLVQLADGGPLTALSLLEFLELLHPLLDRGRIHFLFLRSSTLRTGIVGGSSFLLGLLLFGRRHHSLRLRHFLHRRGRGSRGGDRRRSVLRRGSSTGTLAHVGDLGAGGLGRVRATGLEQHDDDAESDQDRDGDREDGPRLLVVGRRRVRLLVLHGLRRQIDLRRGRRRLLILRRERRGRERRLGRAAGQRTLRGRRHAGERALRTDGPSNRGL